MSSLCEISTSYIVWPISCPPLPSTPPLEWPTVLASHKTRSTTCIIQPPHTLLSHTIINDDVAFRPPPLSRCGYLCVWLRRAGVAHMHAAAGLSSSLPLSRKRPGTATRLASCKVQLHSAARILPLASSAWRYCRQEELGKHLCTHAHSHAKPICIQVQSHTSTHSGMLTDTHNTPPKSHQRVRLLNQNSHTWWIHIHFTISTWQQKV